MPMTPWGRYRLLEGAHFVIGEAQGRGLHELIELLELRRADDRRGDARLAQHPRQGDLDRQHAPGARHLDDAIGDIVVASA